MFQINAILNTSVLDGVLQGLLDEEIQGVTVSNVMGRGCFEDTINALDEKVMIIVLVAGDAHKEKAMEAIRSNAQEDSTHGAGKMWVVPVVEVERIRTGEKNADALAFNPSKEISLGSDDEFFNSVDTPAS
ncbi:MAG: hypothetical protein K0U47_07665 [Epsilonproteobacteria bacterium]|nr:hypothetical protein [Campylobacterota bacterium]